MHSKRIEGYDLARALAVLGMVVVNFKTVMHASERVDAWWLSAFLVLDGRASAIFVILAGVGISLMTQRAWLTQDRAGIRQSRNVLLRRAAFLFVTGLLYVAIWPADILHYYGVYIAVAAFLLGASTPRLLLVAFLIAAAFPVVFFFLNYGQSWDWATLAYADLWSPAGFVRNLFFNGFHPVLPWAAFLLVGMVLGRLPMEEASVRNRVLRWALVWTVAVEALAFLLRATALRSGHSVELAKYLFSTTPMPPLPLYVLSAVGSSLVVIALCVQAGLAWGHSPWMRPWVRTGQMALTLYVGHVVVGMGVLEELGLLSHQPLSVAVGSALVFCAVAVVFAWVWMSRFSLGPLEWLMRKATFSA